jgi:hypothetical protein
MRRGRLLLRVAAALAVLAVLLTAQDALAKRLVFKETVIEGEIQKPEVAVYLTRQNLNDKYALELKESFLPKIVHSVERDPF